MSVYTFVVFLLTTLVLQHQLTHSPSFNAFVFACLAYKDCTSDPALPPPHQHTFSSPHQGEEQYSPPATRRQCSTPHTDSELIRPQTGSPRRVAPRGYTSPLSNQGCVESNRERRGEISKPVSEDSEDSDTVFNKQLSFWCRRLYERPNRTPPQQPAPSQQQHERNTTRFSSRRRCTDEFNSWQEETESLDEEHYKNDDLQDRAPKSHDRERNYRDEGLIRRRDQDTECRSTEVGERPRRRSESVRSHDSSRHRNRELPRTWSCRDGSDKHVRFKDDNKACRQQSASNKVWEMLGHILKERGVPVRFGGSGAPLQIRPQSRDSQTLQGSEGSYRDSQPHQRAFQRAATTRHSFHGDIRERRRLSHQENSRRDHREDQDGLRDNEEVHETIKRDSNIENGERRSSKRWKEHKYTNGDENREGDHRNRVRRTTSDRTHWHKFTEERLSSEEEQEEERRGERHRRRALQRSQSFSSSRPSSRRRLSREAAGNTQTCRGERFHDVLLSSLHFHLIFSPSLVFFPHGQIWAVALGSVCETFV